MTRKPCAGLAELRSALVDNALADADRERVLAHLVRCDSCRLEVEDLRRVRRLLNRTRVQPHAPYDLSHRLVSIAGAEARRPLWCRPFRRTPSGALPSARRVARVRVTGAVLAFGTLVAAAGGVGYASAPPPTLTAITDPSAEARTEFTAALAQFPLSSDAVNAVLMAPSERLSAAGAPSDGTDRQPSTTEASGRSLTADEARAALQRAAEASDQVSYTGTQTVLARREFSTITATVGVDQQPGQGSQVNVFSRAGDSVGTGFTSDLSVPRMADDELLGLLLQTYSLTATTGARVAGRTATVVEATTRGGAFPDRVRAARWWIDDATGLLLWQETYDASGAVTMTAGFTAVRVGGSGSFLKHLAPKLAVPSTTASLTLSSAASLNSQGWACDDELVGLSLVRLRSTEGTDPDVLHLVYSDGLTAVSVFEQRGVLVAAPADAPFDEALGAYVRAGSLSTATWQSGGTVFTVVTDGSPELLRNAVTDLPHDRPLARTTMERIQAGWTRIINALIG